MARKICQVPSVTMKGGSFMREISRPLIRPQSAPTAMPQSDGERRRQAIAEGELTHDDGGQHQDRADREIDAGGQDDQRLRGADDADDGDLLEDEGQREGRKQLAAEQDAEGSQAKG